MSELTNEIQSLTEKIRKLERSRGANLRQRQELLEVIDRAIVSLTWALWFLRLMTRAHGNEFTEKVDATIYEIHDKLESAILDLLEGSALQITIKKLLQLAAEVHLEHVMDSKQGGAL